MKSKTRLRFYKSKPFRLAWATLLPVFVIGYSASSIWAANFLTTSPSRALGSDSPTSVGLPYEDVTFQTAEQDHLKLRGWWIPRKDSKRVLILVHVKNSNRTFFLSIGKQLWTKDFSLLLFDLRGHGQSDGEHYSYGQHEQQDIVGAVNFVKSKGFNPASIGVMGWSMGAASSIMAMSQTPDIKALVSDSSYGDLRRVTNTRLGFSSLLFPGVVIAGRIFLNVDIDQVKPEVSITHLGDRHVFLIHGDSDLTVPVSEFYHLKLAGGANIMETWELPGLGHAQAYSSQPAEYIRRVVAFFNQELA